MQVSDIVVFIQTAIRKTQTAAAHDEFYPNPGLYAQTAENLAWFKNGGFAVTQASGTTPRMNAGIQQRVTQL